MLLFLKAGMKSMLELSGRLNKIDNASLLAEECFLQHSVNWEVEETKDVVLRRESAKFDFVSSLVGK